MGLLTWLFSDDIEKTEKRIHGIVDRSKDKVIEAAKESASHVARGYLIGACIMVAATLLLEVVHKYYFSNPSPTKSGQIALTEPSVSAHLPATDKTVVLPTKTIINAHNNQQQSVRSSNISDPNRNWEHSNRWKGWGTFAKWLLYIIAPLFLFVNYSWIEVGSGCGCLIFIITVTMMYFGFRI